MNIRPVVSSVCIGAAVLLGAVSVPAAAGSTDFSAVTDPIGAYVESRPFGSGAGLKLVDFEGRVLLEQYWGGFTPQTTIPIASATKWLSGAVVAELAARGDLDLDAPLGDVLSEFNGYVDGRGDVTVRQMFSHTSGMAGQSGFLAREDLTLAEAVAGIAASPALMRNVPGEAFSYGGVSMHVAGRVAEAVSGRGWSDLIDQTLQTPLGVSDLTFDGIGVPTNPRIAGGAQTSLETYARFLQMLSNGGVYDGRRVLSEAAVATLLGDQTGFGLLGGAELEYAPPAVDTYLGYGLGNWIERRDADGQPVEWSSPGAFGTTPWINMQQRYFGIFMIDDRLTPVDDLIDDLRVFAAAALAGIPGDFNANGSVEQGDLDLVLNNWGSSEIPGQWLGDRPDVGEAVNQRQLDAVLNNWGSSSVHDFRGVVVPEPHAAAFLISITLLGRRTRGEARSVGTVPTAV